MVPKGVTMIHISKNSSYTNKTQRSEEQLMALLNVAANRLQANNNYQELSITLVYETKEALTFCVNAYPHQSSKADTTKINLVKTSKLFGFKTVFTSVSWGEGGLFPEHPLE